MHAWCFLYKEGQFQLQETEEVQGRLNEHTTQEWRSSKVVSCWGLSGPAPFVVSIPFLFVLRLPYVCVWLPGLQRLHNVPFVCLFEWFFQGIQRIRLSTQLQIYLSSVGGWPHKSHEKSMPCHSLGNLKYFPLVGFHWGFFPPSQQFN